MARNFSSVFTGAVGSTSYPQHGIWQISSLQYMNARPRIFEYILGCSAAPQDYASRFVLVRHTTASPTGGTTLQPQNLDFADATQFMATNSGVSGMAASTGGCTMATALAYVPLNYRATFRWVAAPGKELTIPMTQYHGISIQVAYQSTSYNTDTTLFWEE